MASDSKLISNKTKRLFVLFVRGEGIEVLISIIVVFILFLVKLYFDPDLQVFEWSTFSAIVFTAGLAMCVRFIRRMIFNRIEDGAKLTQNYDELVNTTYKLEQAVTVRNGTDQVEKLACIKVADLTGKKIVIEDDPNTYFELPDIAAENYKDLLRSHLSSTIYNNTNIRVKSWNADRDKFYINTERTTYFSSLVTNRAMDYRLDDGLTIRKVLDGGPVLKPLEASSLSNHLGFNGMLESSDGYFPFVYRKNNVSIGKRTYGNSVGASLKFKFAVDWKNGKKNFTFKGLDNAIRNELLDEIGVGTGDVRYKILCAYRDMVEGGKPQLFIYYFTHLSMDEIDNAFISANSPHVSSSEQDKKVAKMLTDGTRLVWVSKETILDTEKTKIYNDRIETFTTENGVENPAVLKVVPSAAASVVFLRDYLVSKGSGDGNN